MHTENDATDFPTSRFAYRNLDVLPIQTACALLSAFMLSCMPMGKIFFITDRRGENIVELLGFSVHFMQSFFYILLLQRYKQGLYQPHGATGSSEGPAAPSCAPCIKQGSVTHIAADLQKLFYIMVTALYLLTYNRVITTIFKNKTMKSY